MNVMTQPSARTKKIPTADLLPLDTVRTLLGVVWLGGGSIIFVIVVLQSLLGRYGEKTQEAWGWLLPTIMPTLGMIVVVLGYTALDPLLSSSVVRKSFFRVALWLSVLYLLLILLTILIQPWGGTEGVEGMRMSNLWLGPFQGIVASALGVLFVSKQQNKETENRESPVIR